MAVDYAALAKKNGGTVAPAPTTPPAGGNVDYAALAKAQGGTVSGGSPAAPAPSPVSTYVKGAAERIGAGYGEAAKKITADLGGTQLPQQVPGQNAAEALGGRIKAGAILAEKGMRTAGTVAAAAFEPIAVPLGDAISSIAGKISDIPVVQRIATSDAVGKLLGAVKDTSMSLGDISAKHPELAKDAQALADILFTVAGEKPTQEALKAAGGAAKGAGEAVARTAGDLTAEGLSKLGTAAEGATKTLTSPFKSAYKPNVAEAFARQGIEAPASALTTSKAVQATEAIAQSSIFGGSAVTKVINDARESIFRITETLQKEVNPEKLITPGATSETAGRALQGAVTKVRDTFNAVKGKLYDEAAGKIGGQQASLENTRGALDEIIASKLASADPTARASARYYQSLRANLSTAEKRTFQNIKQTRTDIGSKLKNFSDPITTGDSANLKRIYAALSADLDRTVAQSGEAGAEALKAASDFYKAGISRINSFVGRTIYNSKSPELLVGKLVKPGDISTIRELKGLVGPEAHHTFAAALVNKIIADSIVPLTGKVSATKIATILAKYGDEFLKEAIGEKALGELKDLRKASIVQDIIERGTKEGKVMPSALAHAIDSYDAKVLKEAFTPEELTKLQDVRTMSDALAKGTKMADGSQTAMLIDGPAGLLNIGAFAAGGVPGVITKLGFQWGLTKLVTSRLGKKFLTTGFGKGAEIAPTAGEAGIKASEVVPVAEVAPAGKQVAKQGGQEGIYRYSEKGGTAVPRETAKKAGVSVVQKTIDGEARFVLEKRDVSGKVVTRQTFTTKSEAEMEAQSMREHDARTVPKGGR